MKIPTSWQIRLERPARNVHAILENRKIPKHYHIPKCDCHVHTKRREGLSTSTDTREPHPLYYIFHLQETFRRDTAEMAPCQLYLVVILAHFYNRTCEGD